MHNKTEVRRQKSEDRRNPLLSPFCNGGLRGIYVSCLSLPFILSTVYYLLSTSLVFAEELKLQPLIDEALKNNHEVLMLNARESASRFRILQAESLPDPMFMFGYQNDGIRDPYTFDEEMASDSMWMFSVSQMFPYPGKLSLKGQMAARDAESLNALTDSARLKTIGRVKELYYDLFFSYKNIDLIKDKTALFSRIESAALARYSTGMAPQQEVIMAQTEKYMLLEQEEMLKQRVQSLESMLNAAIGRDINSPLGRPSDAAPTLFNREMNELIETAFENSPFIKSKKKMFEGARTKVHMAEKEYYPDFTVNAGYFAKNKYFEDMWSLTATVNVPIFYKTKQRQAVLESKASLEESGHELADTKVMLSSGIRDNYSMLKSSERLMDLYKNGLIPKTYQDFESAISEYTTGKVEALTVITRLKSLIDYEALYWKQFTEREKAIARLEALTASSQKSEVRSQGDTERGEY